MERGVRSWGNVASVAVTRASALRAALWIPACAGNDGNERSLRGNDRKARLGGRAATGGAYAGSGAGVTIEEEREAGI